MPKGTVGDLFFLAVFLLLIGFSIWIGTLLKDKIFPIISSKSSESAEVITKVQTNWDSVFDSLFFFVTIGVGISSVVLAAMIDTHPMFFFISIVMLVILLLIVPTFSNVFRTFASSESFSGFETRFPFTVFIFQHYPLIFLGFGILISIVLYGKLGR